MKIVVYYFSGTGNTEAVAKQLVKALNKLEHETVLRKIENAESKFVEADLHEYDIMGIGYPILGGGTPGLVISFIRSLPKHLKKDIFIFKTAADIVKFNHTASESIIRRLRKKGCDVFYDRIFAMGSNWFIEYDDRMVKQLYGVIPEKTEHMAEEITSGRHRVYEPPLWLTILCRILNFLEENAGARIFGKTLHAADSCTGCGVCAGRCPAGNIKLNDKPVFGFKCMMCMRCVYSCPVSAIKSRGMGFLILKNGYDLKRITENTYENEEYINKDSKGFFEHFYEYLHDRSL